jgi:glucose/mannose transport system permease protein
MNQRISKPGRIALFFIRVVLALFFLLPVYLLVITALKNFADVNFARMWLPPNYISFGSFTRAIVKLGPNVRNSFAMVIPGTILSAIIGSINGYVFSKQRFSGSNILFIFLLFGMFIPYQSIIIPMVYVLQKIAINGQELVNTLPQNLQFLGNFIPGYGSIAGLVLVHVVYGIPLMSLIFRNYYSVVPNEMIEAARLDGASVLGIFRYIILPISIPGFVVAIIWQFTSLWNEFLFAVILISSPAKRPLMVALYSLQGSHITEWNVQMAGALLAALPPLLIYMALGRYFLSGLLAGSVKG